jgi:hypothetical protein
MEQINEEKYKAELDEFLNTKLPEFEIFLNESKIKK